MKNPPAFPALAKHENSSVVLSQPGMTMLDYFAAKAMNGLLSVGAFKAHSSSEQVPMIVAKAFEVAKEMMSRREIETQ